MRKTVKADFIPEVWNYQQLCWDHILGHLAEGAEVRGPERSLNIGILGIFSDDMPGLEYIKL